LRLLTNIQVSGQPLLQIFLLGQPELRDLILSPPMEQVHQRIVASSHLEALELAETEEYVRHRLESVGWRGDPAISKTIFPRIYKFSEGVPRRINLICSRLLLHGSVEQRHEIGVQDIRTVISELQGENLAAGSKFSEGDFALEDEFEQIAYAVESPEVHEQAEVHLHAVVNESFSAPVTESPVADECEQPEPDVAVVTEIPRVKSADIAPNCSTSVAGTRTGADPSGYLDPEPEPEPEVESGPEFEQELKPKPSIGLESEAEPEPELGIDNHVSQPSVPEAATGEGSRTEVQRVSREPNTEGAGVRTALVVLLVALVIAAGSFAVREDAWATLEAKSRAIWESVSQG
jgi:hypothetical protein